MRAATSTLSIIRPSTIEYYDEIDSDDARRQTVGIVGRYFMSINIAGSIRAVKIITVTSLGYILFTRYLKDYANGLVGKFLK